MIIGALDPGKTGAMVILFEDGSTSISRVPLKKTKGKKTSPNYREWADAWGNRIEFASPDVWIIESVHARPGQGVTSMFSFGKFYGFAVGVIMSRSQAPLSFAPPSVWKDKMGLIGFDKSVSVTRALDLVPSIGPELRAKGTTSEIRHGISEAALLAYYGRMTIADV